MFVAILVLIYGDLCWIAVPFPALLEVVDFVGRKPGASAQHAIDDLPNLKSAVDATPLPIPLAPVGDQLVIAVALEIGELKGAAANFYVRVGLRSPRRELR